MTRVFALPVKAFQLAGIFAIACLGGAVGVAVCASASAEPGGDVNEYFRSLDRYGVTYKTLAAGLDAGNQVCTQLRGGTPVGQVANYWFNQTGDPNSASGLLIAASSYLCHDQWAAVDAYSRDPNNQRYDLD